MLEVADLAAFLIGDSQAIRRVLTSRDALPIAAGLVASASLARNYDTRSFWHRPAALFSPFGASFALAVVLYLIVRTQLWYCGSARPPVVAGFLSLLAAYWMTAPLAWLYGLPFERVFSIGLATNARLATLGIVAAWRVVLMGWILTVALDGHVVGAYTIVLDFAGLIVIAALIKAYNTEQARKSTPQLALAMAGIETKDRSTHSKGSKILAFSFFLSLCASPIFVLATALSRVTCNDWNALLAAAHGSSFALGSAVVTPLVAIGFWGVLASICQIRHYRAGEVDRLLKQSQIGPAIERMYLRERSDFPPNWEPEPVPHFREPPTLLAIMENLVERGVGGWPRAQFLAAFRTYLADAIWYYHYPAEFERAIQIIDRLPERGELARLALAAVAAHEQELEPHREHLALNAKYFKEPDKSDGDSRPPPELDLVVPIPPPDADTLRPALLARLREVASESAGN